MELDIHVQWDFWVVGFQLSRHWKGIFLGPLSIGIMPKGLI